MKWKVLIYLLAALLLALSAYDFWPFLADDTLISLRYSQRLIEGKGLTWNDGERVEGYSNLLWVLLISLLGLSGMDLIVATRILSILFSFLVLLFLFRNERDKSPVFQALPPLFYGLSMPISAWTIGGLEQPLLAFLVAGSISFFLDFLDRDDKRLLWLVSLFLGLACLTRPDGPIYSVGLAGGYALVSIFIKRKGLPFRDILILAVFPVLLYGGQIGFRLWYYGDYVPNTAHIKVSPSLNHTWDGIRYIFFAIRDTFPLSLITAIASFSLLRKGSVKGIILVSMLATNLLYIAFIGGDIFPGYRHFVPVVVISCFILMIWTDDLREGRGLAFVLIFSVAIAPFVHRPFGMRHIVKTEKFEWEIKAASQTLRGAFDNPLIAITAAGSYPYFTEFPSLDMLGLNDYHIARQKPEDFGQGWIGHEMGDHEYVKERRPDIVVFGAVGDIPGFRATKALANDREFNEQYRAVRFLAADMRTTPYIYFRLLSEKTGLRKTDAGYVIPGHLFGDLDNIAISGPDSSLALPLNPGMTTELKIPGIYRGRLELFGPNTSLVDIDTELSDSTTTYRLRAEGFGRIDSAVIFTESIKADTLSEGA